MKRKKSMTSYSINDIEAAEEKYKHKEYMASMKMSKKDFSYINIPVEKIRRAFRRKRVVPNV